MKIEWASEFREDGTRRKPPPSKMHGWLAKWRGTFSGNEDLRSEGIREMKAADKRERDIKARNGGGFLRLFKTSKKPTARPPARHLSKSKPASSSGSSSGRPAPASRSGSSRPAASRQGTRTSHRTGTSRDRPSNSRRSSRR